MTSRLNETEKGQLFGRVKELFKSGMTPKEVAKELGTSSSNIFKIVQHQGYRITREYGVEEDAGLMAEKAKRETDEKKAKTPKAAKKKAPKKAPKKAAKKKAAKKKAAKKKAVKKTKTKRKGRRAAAT